MDHREKRGNTYIEFPVNLAVISKKSQLSARAAVSLRGRDINALTFTQSDHEIILTIINVIVITKRFIYLTDRLNPVSTI